LWVPETGELITELEFAPGRVRSLVVDPLGEHLIGALGTSDVCWWSVDSGSLVRRVQDAGDFPLAVAASMDGELIAISSLDHEIQLRDQFEGTLIRTLRGHTRAVVDLAFGFDSEVLYSTSDDGSLRRWLTRVGGNDVMLQTDVTPVGLSCTDDGSQVLIVLPPDAMLIADESGGRRFPVLVSREAWNGRSLEPTGTLVALPAPDQPLLLLWESAS